MKNKSLKVQARELLIKARQLLAKRGAWGQNQYAVDARGEQVSVYAPEAKCWCLLGGLMRVDGEGGPSGAYSKARDALTKQLDLTGVAYPSPAHWNDMPKRKKREVLALIDATVERLSK